LFGYALLRRRLRRQEAPSTQPRQAQPPDLAPTPAYASATRRRVGDQRSASSDRRPVTTVAASQDAAVVANTNQFEVVGGHGSRVGCSEQRAAGSRPRRSACVATPGNLTVPASFPARMAGVCRDLPIPLAKVLVRAA